ncbi:MAG: FtsH protease activity modulator HflK [Gammaproteobacteria bacterium]|nr:FtsH protease activity modulator HflK [Gammaproteobacteria bacterium]
MAWNEPGGSGNKDPWGGRNDQQGPPDLDEIIKKLQKKFSGLFGGKGGGGSNGSGAGMGKAGAGGASFFLILVLAVWALSGIYIVDEGRQGVVLQFGAFKEISDPGPHWYPRFIQSVEVVNVDQVRSVNLGLRKDEGLMLTQDENIVDIKFTIQYKVKDARNFLFNVRDPDATLRQATESAMREIVGKNGMDFVIKDGRPQVGARTKLLIQEILDGYKTGILVSQLNLQDAQPPQQVQHAFNDAIKAREDEQRQINEAEAYSNDILPKARGAAARMIQEAEAYREQVVSRAKGEAERFTKVLVEYNKAPKVTRQRLYLEAMETVLSRTNKVMIDVKKGNSMIYLPLDKIVRQGGSSQSQLNSTDNSSSEPATTTQRESRRDRFRTREVR